jgi:MvaI/BcnI restriction endonuclease family
MDHNPTLIEREAISTIVEELGEKYVTIRLTDTMLGKSIIDASEPIQLLLKLARVAEYAAMNLGRKEGGVDRELPLITAAEARTTRVSFYRPQTKSGDPRFWPYGLAAFARQGDLLLIFATTAGVVLVVVSSQTSLLVERVRALARSLGLSSSTLASAALILKDRFAGIRDSGWIEATGHGPRCVGETFERAMGLSTNSYSRPDFMGEIEIKASRSSKTAHSSRLQTLVSLAPIWEGSIQSTKDLVQAHGYDDAKRGRKALYCSIFTSINRLGWRLQIDVGADAIIVAKNDRPILRYSIIALAAALERKHPATLFVSARTRRNGAREAFHYFAARYCQGFNTVQFIDELLAGNACLDLTAHLKGNGTGRDHGYLWRIKGDRVESVFSYRRDLIENITDPGESR